MSEGRAKGPSLTALQHKWRELTVPAVRCRDPARAKPMLGVWQLAQRPRMDRRNQRPLNSDLDREAASPSVALWQRGFVSPKLPAAAAAQSPQQKTRRGVPPGHGRILLDRAFSIRDSGNTSQGQKALDPAALMTARRTIGQPHRAVHPPLFDSRSPPSDHPPAC